MCEFPKTKKTSSCNSDGEHMIHVYQSPEVGRAKFELCVTRSDSGHYDGKGGITVSFKSGIGKWYQIDDRFQQVISNILGDQHPPPSILPTETEQVLAWGNDEEGILHDMCFHEVFDTKSQLHPYVIDLIHREGSMSMNYREMGR